MVRAVQAIDAGRQQYIELLADLGFVPASYATSATAAGCCRSAPPLTTSARVWQHARCSVFAHRPHLPPPGPTRPAPPLRRQHRGAARAGPVAGRRLGTVQGAGTHSGWAAPPPLKTPETPCCAPAASPQQQAWAHLLPRWHAGLPASPLPPARPAALEQAVAHFSISFTLLPRPADTPITPRLSSKLGTPSLPHFPPGQCWCGSCATRSPACWRPR
jgi:hypothetical protein